MTARISEHEARRIGVKLPRKAPAARTVAKARPDLTLHPGLARLSERDVQRTIRRDLLRALPPGSKAIAIPNQRTFGKTASKLARIKSLRALIADGMEVGACDLLFIWDARLGAPGNRGVAWVEVKKPINPEPVSDDQRKFHEAMRFLGFAVGVARCVEEAEAILAEAGAPLRFRVLRPAASARGASSQTNGAPLVPASDAPERRTETCGSRSSSRSDTTTN